MEFVNVSNLPAEVFTALDKTGRESLIIVAKATYRFGAGERVALSEVQCPIAATDVFVGESGLSATLYEADLAPVKKRCDVILDATAHAPDERPVTELPVGIRIGSLSKQFLVVGDRAWTRGAVGISSTRPRPFTSMPLHYGRAFGGSAPRKARKDGAVEVDTYLGNPVGVGYFPDTSSDLVEGVPLPNTEDFRDRVTTPAGAYRPLAFGPIGRHWDPRRNHAGTYDRAWREEVFPLLPADFDEAFFQCAPSDQQIDFPRGGELVVLHHLVPGRPLVQFELPRPDLALKVLYSSHKVDELIPVVDTLFIEPDKGLVTYVYRASIRLPKRGVFGVQLVAAGPVCERWWMAQVFGSEDCGCGGRSEDDAASPGGDGGSKDAAAEEA